MKVKLTLSVEEDVIKKARSVAKNAGASISALVEQYLLQLIQKESPETDPGISSFIRSLKGSIPVDKNISPDTEITTLLETKYLP